jgi:hypothetical protein
MFKDWRISSFNGVLLAAYFIPAWAIVAYDIMIAPVHGLYERPSVAVALFISDHLQMSGVSTVRVAWLLALGRLTVVAFLAMFVVQFAISRLRRTETSIEAFGIAILIGSLISCASMVMASKVGEIAALKLHATELMMLLGAAIVLVIEHPVAPRRKPATEAAPLEQPQLAHNH